MEQEPRIVGQPEPVARSPRRAWEDFVLEKFTGRNLTNLELNYPDLRRTALPSFEFTSRKTAVTGILDNFYSLERNVLATYDEEFPPTYKSYLSQKVYFYKELADNMRKRKNFHLIPQLIEGLQQGDNEIHDFIGNIMYNGIITLYLLAGDSDRFLVGLKDGTYWKRNPNLNVMNEENAGQTLENIASTYMFTLRTIGRTELPAVPEKIVPLGSLERVRIPQPARSIEDLLEDAYYRLRYIVPHEGADVRFRRAGDLERITLVQSGNVILARVETSYGDEFVMLGLEDATFFSPDNKLASKPGENVVLKPVWATIVAETYHDLVTADEVPTKGYRSLRRKSTKIVQDREIEPEDAPQVIYIPRKVRVGQKLEPRSPYEGPPRPMKIHFVTNYKRSGNMTEKHRKELLQLEREWGIKFVDKIPAGYTWVRPHFSPQGSEVNLINLPIFIKRKIETQIAEGL